MVKDALPEPPDGFHHKIPFPYGEATQLEREWPAGDRKQVPQQS